MLLPEPETPITTSTLGLAGAIGDASPARLVPMAAPVAGAFAAAWAAARPRRGRAAGPVGWPAPARAGAAGRGSSRRNRSRRAGRWRGGTGSASGTAASAPSVGLRADDLAEPGRAHQGVGDRPARRSRSRSHHGVEAGEVHPVLRRLEVDPDEAARGHQSWRSRRAGAVAMRLHRHQGQAGAQGDEGERRSRRCRGADRGRAPGPSPPPPLRAPEEWPRIMTSSSGSPAAEGGAAGEDMVGEGLEAALVIRPPALSVLPVEDPVVQELPEEDPVEKRFHRLDPGEADEEAEPAASPRAATRGCARRPSPRWAWTKAAMARVHRARSRTISQRIEDDVAVLPVQPVESHHQAGDDGLERAEDQEGDADRDAGAGNRRGRCRPRGARRRWSRRPRVAGCAGHAPALNQPVGAQSRAGDRAFRLSEALGVAGQLAHEQHSVAAAALRIVTRKIKDVPSSDRSRNTLG